MNILLSAYACAPNIGSEPGIAWNFAQELSRNPAHQVTVVTRRWNQDRIENYFKEEQPQPDNLAFWYFELPDWTHTWWKTASIFEHIYCYYWEYFLAPEIKRKMKTHSFDVIHHITLGVFRTPSFLGNLGVPFVFGPVGGGEAAPFRLLKSSPRDGQIKDKLRHYVNVISSFNPVLWKTFRQSDLILCKTSETQAFVPKKYHHKCRIALELGIPDNRAPVKRETNRAARKLLYVGRLEYWKGIHFAIRAFASLHQSQPDLQFTIIGGGRDETWLKEEARKCGVEEKIEWIPRVPQQELFQMYQDYDLLFFPSMHDSSGGAVLESLHFGLPVICLDLGGPKEILDANSGVVVSTAGKDEAQVVKGLEEAVRRVADDSAYFSDLQQGALARAAGFRWPTVVEKTYDLIRAIPGLSQSIDKKPVN